MSVSRLAASIVGAGVVGAVLVVPSAPARRSSAAPKTTVTVLAGRPSELAFKLSKLSQIAPGAIVFKVTNDGVAFHTFKICTSTAKNDAKNTCTGRSTAVLKHGNSATLTVVLKKGVYEYLCTVAGHAAAGMKGLIGVGVKVTSGVVAVPKPPSPNPVTTTPSPSPAPSPAPTPTAECPPGQTIAANGPGDQDDDDTGAVSDGDGCI